MPGQTGRKRTKREREADMIDIAKWWTRGMTQMQIAEKLNEARPYNLSRVQIHHDIDAILRQWRAERLSLVEDQRLLELAKVNQVEQTAWNEWERSRKKDENTGDPRYLTSVQWCVEKRAKLLGLNAPSEVNLNTKAQVNLRTLPEEELDQLERIMSKLDATPAESNPEPSARTEPSQG